MNLSSRTRRRTTARVLLAASAACAMLLCIGVVSASAQIVVDPATGHVYGVARPYSPLKAGAPAFPATCNADSSDCAKLSYGNGPVMSSEHDYLLFWAPAGHSEPAAYETGLESFLHGAAAASYLDTNPWSVDEQYYSQSGSTKSFVPYNFTDSGAYVDTDPYPAKECNDTDGNGVNLSVCVDDAQIQAELKSFVAAHHLPDGLGTEYFVFFPSGVGSCFAAHDVATNCAYSGFCGYHGSEVVSGQELLYTDMPWLYNEPGCDLNANGFPVGYPNKLQSDAEASVFSHESSETMTDPVNGSGWTQSAGGADQGYEIGDKCAYIYGSGGYTSLAGLANNGNGYYNTRLAGKDYLLQLEFDNRIANCALKTTDVQPAVTVSVSPTSPVHGSPATFTATVTDSHGVKSVTWGFGDTTTGSGTSVTHTYASAGTYTVATVVTDNDGQQKRVTTSVTVS